ncbi:hypothetical protein FEM08_11260 [Flavobacterium gilvum]|nr:hypothetical protein FEM08_11260 [Flavobacterium gilvum]
MINLDVIFVIIFIKKTDLQYIEEKTILQSPLFGRIFKM